MAPAARPPEFLISATSDLIKSRYSSQSDFADQRFVETEHTGRRVPKSHHTGTGERGCIDDHGWIETARVGEHVSEHQPAFSVGIDDLDVLAEMALYDVAGIHGGTRR